MIYILIEEKLDELLSGQRELKKLLTSHQKVFPDAKVYDTKDLERLLRVSERTLATWRKAGKIRFTMVGRKVYHTQKDLDEFLTKYKK